MFIMLSNIVQITAAQSGLKYPQVNELQRKRFEKHN